LGSQRASNDIDRELKVRYVVGSANMTKGGVKRLQQVRYNDVGARNDVNVTIHDEDNWDIGFYTLPLEHIG
jgi:hypothetical protein